MYVSKSTYFYIFFQVPIGVITISRNCLEKGQVPDLSKSTKPFRKCLIQLEGTIEDCTGAVQVKIFIIKP